MKFGSCLLALCLLTSSLSHAEGLSESDKAKLLETLEKILHGNESAEDKNIREALKVLTSAAADENAAFDLFEKATKKVEFEDKDKKDKEWREWKEKNKDRLSDSAFKRVLKYKCQWAVLTLQASKNKDKEPDYSQYSSQTLSMLNSIAAEFKDLKKFRGEMMGGILRGPVGEILKVNSIQAIRWPDSIFDINGVFERIIFPQYRNAADISGLRSAWNKRLALALAFSPTKDDMNTMFQGQGGKTRGSGSKTSSGTSTAKSDISDEAITAINRLRWQCEQDCFKIGDEAAASVNMLNLIRATKDTREQNRMIQELTSLLSDKPEEGMDAIGNATSNRPIPYNQPAATPKVPKYDDADFVYDGPTPARETPPPAPKKADKPSVPHVVEITDEVEAPKPAEQKPQATAGTTEQPKPAASEQTGGGATPPKKADDDFFGDD